MKTIEYRFVDKSKWPDGEWLAEPDKVQWQDEKTGLPCLAVRHPTLGHWCGYVGITENHPDFGKDYDSVDYEAHGGLTYASPSTHHRGEHGICHIPDEGETDKVWWFGFDCAHYYDISPGSSGLENLIYEQQTYRTLDFVKGECANLAKSLVEIKIEETE